MYKINSVCTKLYYRYRVHSKGILLLLLILYDYNLIAKNYATEAE